MRAAAAGRGWPPAGARERTVYKPPARSRGGLYGRKAAMCGALGVVFVLGYVPGVLAARGSGYGISALAEHYMDKQTFAELGTVFADTFAGAFIQATLLLLCGFCALGLGLMAAFFAIKGMYMGYCAAGIYAAGGARDLAVYWLLTGPAALGVLLALVALAFKAVPLSFALLRDAFGERTLPEETFANARALILRYALTVAVAALCCGLGSAFAVFLAGILL